MERFEPPHRLRFVCRLTAASCLIYATLAVGANIWAWLFADRAILPDDLQDILTQLEFSSLTAGLRGTGLAIGLGVNLFLAAALTYLGRAFLAFANGRIFHPVTIQRLRTAALFALLSSIAQLFYLPMLSLAWSIVNYPGKATIQVNITGADLANFMITALLFVLAWAFAEGRKVRDELESFV